MHIPSQQAVNAKPISNVCFSSSPHLLHVQQLRVIPVNINLFYQWYCQPTFLINYHYGHQLIPQQKAAYVRLLPAYFPFKLNQIPSSVDSRYNAH